jgi:hypothetical protein
MKEKHMGQQTKHLTDEADVGSGEKNAAQKDIEREERSIPPNHPEETQANMEGKILHEGTHLARILAVKLPDETYEAQVYVRLTREPEVAETYIPAGTYPTEAEAWGAAEERARRAFQEKEF